jgi:hypothetical protein
VLFIVVFTFPPRWWFPPNIFPKFENTISSITDLSDSPTADLLVVLTVWFPVCHITLVVQ